MGRWRVLAAVVAAALPWGPVRAGGLELVTRNQAGGQIRLTAEPCPIAEMRGRLAYTTMSGSGTMVTGCWTPSAYRTVTIVWLVYDKGELLPTFVPRRYDRDLFTPLVGI